MYYKKCTVVFKNGNAETHTSMLAKSEAQWRNYLIRELNIDLRGCTIHYFEEDIDITNLTKVERI